MTPDDDRTHEGPLTIEEGARFGDLTLGRKIGQGAQGVVYLGRQTSVGRTVAVKILPKEVTFTGEQVERFHREAEAEGRLNHPNIVAVYGYEEIHGHHLILLEFVEGGSLEEVLDDKDKEGGRTNLNDCTWAAGMCQQIAEALEHAHQNSVIHRDIKPGNVLLTKNGQPKLTDFGLAKVEDMMGLSTTGAVMGTPYYMSPEQVAAKKDGLDARTDVYSLGVLLYRMLCKQLPFNADSMQAIFLDILTRAPKPPRKLQPGIHPDLEAVCLKALEKAPDDRYDSAQAFADDLQRYLKGESTMARPVSVIGRSLRAVKRQATSTLAILPLLFITAWFAVDQLGLKPMTAGNLDIHYVRLGLIGLVTLLVAWPFSLLGVRLAHAHGWGAYPGWGLGLALGGVAAFIVWEQRVDQRHGIARASLAANLVNVGRRDVDDVDAFVSEWADRFGPVDRLLVARTLLQRDRATQARPWADQLEVEAGLSPSFFALMTALYEAMGETKQAQIAEEHLWDKQVEGGTADDWRQAGDILRDMGRYADARKAYVKAAKLPGADRDAMNLMLAQATEGLCEWEEAKDFLNDFRKWNDDDPEGLRMALLIAIKEQEWADAQELLAAYEAHDEIPAAMRIREHHDLLSNLGTEQETEAFVRESYEAFPDDPEVVHWCAHHFYTRGALSVRYYQAYARADHADADRHRANADRFLSLAEEYYRHLDRDGERSYLGHSGLSAVALKRADLEPERAAEHLQTAMSEAEEAIALDPLFFEGHFSLGLATKKLSLLEQGVSDSSEMSLDAIEAYVTSYRRSLTLNGLQTQVLNDTADALNRIYVLTGQTEALDAAFDYVKRALRQRQVRMAGACDLSDGDRLQLSAYHDTIATSFEHQGDLKQALVAARASLAALDGGAPASVRGAIAKRQGRIAELARRVDGDG